MFPTVNSPSGITRARNEAYSLICIVELYSAWKVQSSLILFDSNTSLAASARSCDAQTSFPVSVVPFRLQDGNDE